MMSYLEKVLSPREAPSSSGGGISEDGKLSYGYSSLRGKRPCMEDFYEAKISEVEGQVVGLFGVFDGHGGTRTAEYVKNHLFDNLIQHPQFRTDIKTAIAESYKQTDMDHLKEEEKVYRDRDAGSTASTAVLVGDKLTVANVGDSRAVLSREGMAVAVTTDHKPNRADERQRIEEAGGFVMWDGTWRVGGVLAVSRAFGNRLLKTYVVADPYIEETKVNEEVEFLIIASDGVWDVISNEDAVAMVQEIEDAEEAAKAVTGGAFTKGSADNITCVVIRFHHGHA